MSEVDTSNYRNEKFNKHFEDEEIFKIKLDNHKHKIQLISIAKEFIEEVESGEYFKKCMYAINNIGSTKKQLEYMESEVKKYEEENKNKVVIISNSLQKRVEEVISRFSDQWFFCDNNCGDEGESNDDFEQPFYTNDGKLDWYNISEMYTDDDIIKMFGFDKIK